MSEIKISTEIRHHVFNMPKEYFLIEEIYEQFDRFNVYDVELSPGYEYYVGSFDSMALDGNKQTVTIFSSEFKKETNGK